MQKEEINEILACLPEGKTHYYYFKDRYALQLLGWIAGDGVPKQAIKQSPYAKLLNKPVVSEALAQTGTTLISDRMLQAYWPPRPECYLLTLGTWGGDHISMSQTSRRGHNLVLQLNFSSGHNRAYRELIAPEFRPFECRTHPIAREGYLTLAWARIDLNLEDGEALIEEIQNDWIRNALGCQSRVEWLERSEHPVPRLRKKYLEEMKLTSEAMAHYIDTSLRPHMELWDEAMLSAAVWFLKEEIGIDRIFYHTFESGARLKRITGTLPPRSLYTKLPKKLCFTETSQVPQFLQRDLTRGKKRRHETFMFQLLELAS